MYYERKAEKEGVSYKKHIKLIWIYSKHLCGKVTAIVFYFDVLCIFTAVLASFMSI